jgi:hypothetical protein
LKSSVHFSSEGTSNIGYSNSTPYNKSKVVINLYKLYRRYHKYELITKCIIDKERRLEPISLSRTKTWLNNNKSRVI